MPNESGSERLSQLEFDIVNWLNRGLAGDLGQNLPEEEKSELIKRLNNQPSARAKLEEIIPMVQRLSQGRTPERGEIGETVAGQRYQKGALSRTPQEKWLGDDRRVEENRRLIELLLKALGQTQPIEPPQERGLELGPENAIQEARQDATAQAQVSKLFR